MRLPILAAVLTFASTAQAEKPAKPELVVTRAGKDLHVTVHAVTDYCSTDADTRIERSSDTIRILQDRPSRVSRCITTQERSFVVKDVKPGHYMISFERMPLVAPARAIRIAWSHVTVE